MHSRDYIERGRYIGSGLGHRFYTGPAVFLCLILFQSPPLSFTVETLEHPSEPSKTSLIKDGLLQNPSRISIPTPPHLIQRHTHRHRNPLLPNQIHPRNIRKECLGLLALRHNHHALLVPPQRHLLGPHPRSYLDRPRPRQCAQFAKQRSQIRTSRVSAGSIRERDAGWTVQWAACL